MCLDSLALRSRASEPNILLTLPNFHMILHEAMQAEKYLPPIVSHHSPMLNRTLTITSATHPRKAIFDPKVPLIDSKSKKKKKNNHSIISEDNLETYMEKTIPLLALNNYKDIVSIMSKKRVKHQKKQELDISMNSKQPLQKMNSINKIVSGFTKINKQPSLKTGKILTPVKNTIVPTKEDENVFRYSSFSLNSEAKILKEDDKIQQDSEPIKKLEEELSPIQHSKVPDSMTFSYPKENQSDLSFLK
jgi:hypothetical protein